MRLPQTALFAALATGLAGVPVRSVLIRANLLDVPNHRSSHASPVPRGGGLALLAGGILTCAVSRTPPSGANAARVLGLASIGASDDLSGHISPAVRLIGQLAIGALSAPPGVKNRASHAFATSTIVNVFNFMDGIDGISASTAMLWGANAMTLPQVEETALFMGALVAGCGAGFLPHNVPIARMFLGDCGSYSLGAAISAGTMSQTSYSLRYQLSSPLLLYGVDTAQALVKRLAKRQPLGTAHRDHVYQRLVDQGHSHIAVTSLHTTLSLVIAYASRHPQQRSAIAATMVATAAYLLSPRLSSSVTSDRGEPAGGQSDNFY